jgi:hypothetical protein
VLPILKADQAMCIVYIGILHHEDVLYEKRPYVDNL